MIRVLIVDDERRARESLSRLLENDVEIQIVDKVENGDEALKQLAKTEIDVVFLDVEMPGMSGLEVATALTDMETPPVVVFATAYDQYAIEAFEASAVDYILKPYEPTRIARTVERVKTVLKTKEKESKNLSVLSDQLIASGRVKRLIGFKPGSKIRKVLDPNEIICFVVKYSEVRARLEGEEYVIRSSLQDIMNVLDKSEFAQTHKAYIVNIAKIDSVQPMFHGNYEISVKGKDDLKIPLSRKYVPALKAIMGSW
jgi:two-component system response regulator LytT